MYKYKHEVMSNKAVVHSSLGEFKKGDHKTPPHMKSGGHGEENIQRLKQLGIKYNIVEQYPNGVRLGNIPSHWKKTQRTGTGHTWFPKSWTRRTIKNAAEKVANSIKYKLPDGYKMFGTYRNVKVAVIRTKGKIATVFPYYKQTGGVKKWRSGKTGK